MQATRRRDTPGELALRSALHALGLRYRVDAKLRGTRRRPDVVFARAKVAVFVDGCFWHGCPIHATSPRTNAKWWARKLAENRDRDASTNAHLREGGWHVVRVWTHESMTAAAKRIARVVRRRTVQRAPRPMALCPPRVR
jgi:DNA mismatch endonuclease (patch repair protein)